MKWIEISIDTVHEGLDTVCARLSMLGIDSFCVQDETEFQAHWEKTEQNWELVDSDLLTHMKGLCRITFYVRSEAYEILDAVRRMITSLPGDCPMMPLGTLALSENLLSEEDWAENWKQYYKPLPIGKRLLIQPAWQPLSDAEGRAVFLNNPGMSFGTGEHETTRLCLEQIEQLVTGGELVLDVGCGSGILSICALLLGAAQAHAVDIDPYAAAAARKNAEANGLDDGTYRTYTGNLLDPAHTDSWPGPYQLIAANITADVLIALCPLLAVRLAPDGVLVLSGVIGGKKDDVVHAIEDAGLHLEEESAKRDWCCFIVRR